MKAIDTKKMLEEAREAYLKHLALLEDKYNQALSKIEQKKEPLIKDPKIRKVIRAWAEINNFEPDYSVMYEAGIFGLTSYQADIEFNFPLKELEGGKDYTISELCGSEE